MWTSSPPTPCTLGGKTGNRLLPPPSPPLPLCSQEAGRLAKPPCDFQARAQILLLAWVGDGGSRPSLPLDLPSLPGGEKMQSRGLLFPTLESWPWGACANTHTYACTCIPNFSRAKGYWSNTSQEVKFNNSRKNQTHYGWGKASTWLGGEEILCAMFSLGRLGGMVSG